MYSPKNSRIVLSISLNKYRKDLVITPSSRQRRKTNSSPLLKTKLKIPYYRKIAPELRIKWLNAVRERGVESVTKFPLISGLD